MRLPPVVRRATTLPLLALFSLVLALAGSSQSAQALSTTVVISQVYGGGGNSGAPYTNDFVELFNRGATTVSLSGMSVQYASATGTGNFAGNPIAPLAGSLAPGQHYLVQLASGGANGVALPTADATGTANMSGTGGKVALVNATTGLACNGGSTPCSAAQLAQIVDLVGLDGANFYEGSAAAPATSNTTAALRKGNGCTETDNNSADFETIAPNPRNTVSPLSPCVASDTAPSVVSTTPADGAAGIAANANIVVTFSEPVNVTGAWFTLACSISGTKAATVTGGPATFTLDPATDFANGDACSLTVLAANVSDQDTNDPPDSMTANVSVGFSTLDVCPLPFTPIPAIQGSGATVALPGAQTTQGVVVADYEGPSPALRGFFIQDPVGDGNPATSDGIFVFEGSNANTVSLGDVVRVTGTAGENQGQSQISVGTIVKCGTGTVTPTDVTLPFVAADAAEVYEGMLVRLPQTLRVTEHFQLGRFGQVVLSANGRLRQPTDAVAPGAPANSMQSSNNLNRIILDDGSQAQNPDPIVFGRGGQPLSASNTLRGGDTATGIVGVMTYTWAGNAASGNAYRVRPINALGGSVNFQPANLRPSSSPDVGGGLKVVGMNLLNYFNTFSGCALGVGGGSTDCRGAENQTEFDRQWPKTVAAILGLDADIVGLVELENDGYGPTSAIQDVVSRLNAATAPGTWAFIDADSATGQVNALGTDAIKVALIYKPAKVTPVGQTAVLNSEAFVNGGDSAPRNRASLAQAFEQVGDGARLVVNVNHLKSKGSPCDAPDAGDGQGNCNVVRTNAATQLSYWLQSDPTGTGDADILIVGDLNSYAKEDPITALQNAGFVNLVADKIGPDAYSYVFDGQWGYLDYALGSASLTAKVSGVGEWHINADEPSVLDYNTNFKSAGQLASLYAPDEYRISDHDPVLVGLNLNEPPTVNAGGPYTVTEGQSVSLTAAGSDPDGGPLAYAWDLDNNGSFETPGQSATFTAPANSAPATYTVKVRVTDVGGLTAVATAQVSVIWHFTGFFSPVDNLPTFNVVNSGRAIPIKFSLGGNQGLGIFAPGYPASVPITCDTAVSTGAMEPTSTAGASGLQYSPGADKYTYVWKTEKSWSNSCRQFVLKLTDGTTYRANFNFTR